MLKKIAYFLFLPLVIISSPLWAETPEGPVIKYAVPDSEQSYVAKLDLHTTAQVEQMLKRAEVYVENIEQYPNFQPITVILHGPEVMAFDRRNYKEYKHIVGLAARLEAFNVIDVQVCEIQMKREGISRSDLPAFVETVPYGPAEEKRLLKKGYQYF